MVLVDRPALTCARTKVQQREKLSISSRPSTIANVQPHTWKLVRLLKLPAGPTVPSPGAGAVHTSQHGAEGHDWIEISQH
jgi:hypothetical protein